MKNYRILARVFILLLIFFIACCAKPKIVVQEPAPRPPEEVKPTEVKPPEAILPPIKPPVVKYDRYTLGCLLPLSGQHADLGSKALDAILLSAGMFDGENRTLWKVVAEDSRGLPEGARAAVEHLANSENVMAIVAVTGTEEAIEAAREANKWEVPLILITSKEGITSLSEYVFQHFLTPTQQIRAIVKYALDDLNCAIFSILYPKDDYGEEMVKIFRAEAARIGGKVERAIPYNKNQTDFTEEINKVTGNLISTAKKTSSKKTEVKAQLALDFEALFIPDSYRRVRMITSQLAFYDVKDIKLLGASLWNSPYLLKKGSDYLEGAVFADSFFANSFYPETNDFVDAYYTAYSRDPENIEALAYDTAGIIFRVLENKNIQTRQEFINALIKVENYKGATGNISFGSDRVAQKTPFILRVKNGKLEQVK
jgi:ABC-type branched-subunit amino acid transport system substrate-binding protein